MTDAPPTCTRCGEPWLSNSHRCQDELVARLRAERDALLDVVDAAKALRADPTYRSKHIQGFDAAIAYLIIAIVCAAAAVAIIVGVAI